eukprot:5887602-Prymnesium_polylepis.1
MDRLQTLNSRLEVSAPTADDLLARYAPPEEQGLAAFAHDTEIGRLTYEVWPSDGAAAAVTENEAVRALLRRTRRSL